MSEDRRTIKNWAARLSAPDEPLTLEEARTLAAIAGTDRLLEVRDLLADLRDRVQRMEMFLEERMPGYADHAGRMKRLALAEGTEGRTA